MRSVVYTACLIGCLAVAAPASAQSAAPPPASAVAVLTFSPESLARALDGASEPGGGAREAQQTGPSGWAAEGRACEGCPRRRVWAPYLQATLINVAYNLGNHARGEETAKVTPKTWWNNLKFGFEWDENPFLVNQFGHPYQGNNYFTSGRANGLSFWESTSVAAFGSATWEYFGENNYGSFNDFINTTLGGIALGEMFHRTGWLMRDTTASGKSRLWQEIAATIVDPLTGANRFISGDASRVSAKPEVYVPSALAAYGSFGVLWQGEDGRAFESSPDVFLEMDLRYGEITRGRSRTPYEAFTVDFRLGGGKPISDVRVRGRLIGQPLGEDGAGGADGKVQLTLAQSYDFIANQAYEFGRQGFDMAFSGRARLGSRVGALLIGGVGVTVLGAVDSIRPALSTFGDAPDAGAESEAPEEDAERDYDYGPGTSFGAGIRFQFDGYTFANVAYQGYQIYVVDGIRANHVLQRFRLDLVVPVRGRFAAGATGEYFYRKTYYQAGGEARDKFPQFRLYLAWRRS